ncbi:GNAT family N-acetyltransferase [Clostridium sp. 'White wine YQ']|uniref:GNAT family N-acetyltransferase n=1 Tax=Clostridium sp. 'White wine YQ' TaxID=3027474 RepID=UPI0023669583|nr:GNAT family protein [Clostridium sp. 'White wine YQ']MDD7793296.1 GNAT family protein [Clostridium sp. 'White wine YQ']
MKLELMNKDDFYKIVDWNKDKSGDFLLQWAGPSYTYPITIVQIEDHYFNEVQRKDSNAFIYKIIGDGDEVIGTIELRETDKVNKVGRVCRFLIGEEKVRGKGIGAKALNEVLRIGFEEMGFKKITLGVFDFNIRAIKCYEKVGFKKEKFMENSRKASNGYWNLYDMGISKEEWELRYEKS